MDSTPSVPLRLQRGRSLLRAQARLAHFLDSFYPLPDPMDTESQWEKYTHRDLRNKTRSALLLDRAMLRNRLMYDPHPHPWLIDRWNHIEAALDHAR